MNKCRLLFTLLSTLVLGACRIPVFVEGEGFIWGEQARALYADGQVIEVDGAYSETFRPVPAPGHYFKSWRSLCNGQPAECAIDYPAEAAANDGDSPLGVRYMPNYDGPLEMVDFELWWYSASREMSIPAASLDVAGADPAGTPLLFVASRDLDVIVPAERRGDDYRFQLPPGADPDDYWPFVTATDTEGVIASASILLQPRDLRTTTKLKMYSGKSPWAGIVEQCATAANPFQLCSVDTLPLLGTGRTNISTTDIMHRTVVSNGWMGKRFSQLLQAFSPEFRKLFRGVTAVVIARDIRPSYYLPSTGVIHLDPQDLWLTPSERATISAEPDYREEYGEPLPYIPYWFYASGNTYAWRLSGEWPEGSTRTIDDILLPMANLLAHELTHANDAIPPSALPSAAGSVTPLDLVYRYYATSPSRKLYQAYPLYSRTLFDLADALYGGDPIEPYLLSLTARSLGLEFAGDTANDLYGYSAPQEDTAMLVEEVLTNYYFGVDRVVTFLDDPGPSADSCNDFIVRWGSRNRAGDPRVRERARLVLQGVLGQLNVARYFDALPGVKLLSTGHGLCQSFALPELGGSTPGQYLSLPRLAAQQLRHVSLHRDIYRELDRGQKRHADR